MTTSKRREGKPLKGRGQLFQNWEPIYEVDYHLQTWREVTTGKEIGNSEVPEPPGTIKRSGYVILPLNVDHFIAGCLKESKPSFVLRLSDGRGLDIAISAFSTVIRESGTLSNWRLNVVGLNDFISADEVSSEITRRHDDGKDGPE